jgi:hypothetical protein
MREGAALRREQRGVALGIGAAILLASAAVLVVLLLRPPVAPPLPDLAERLAYALRLQAGIAIWLGLAIANVARLRFFSAVDIGGSANSESSPAMRRAGAVLQNTLEQSVLAMAAHLALAAQPEPFWMPLLPVLVLLFGLGRLCFWIGYARGAAARAFGFALTFYPSMATLVLGLVFLLAG